MPGLGAPANLSASIVGNSVTLHWSPSGSVVPTGYVLEGGLASAEDEGAAAVLITLDTPGGLDSSMREITQAILNAEVPVIVIARDAPCPDALAALI